MHIAELYKNRACLEDLTSELPEDIEYDREAECLRAARNLPESSRWGPFCFEIVSSPQDAHLSVLTTGSHQSDVTLFVRLKVKGERWLMLLNFADADAASSEPESDAEEPAPCNMAIDVNVSQQTLYLRALRCLPQGARLVARLSDSSECGGASAEQPSKPSVALEVAEPSAATAFRGRKRPASADDCRGKLPRLDIGININNHSPNHDHDYNREKDGSSSEEDDNDEDEAPSAVAPCQPPPPGVLGSLRYCDACGLFFTSSWMLEVHRQFHGAFDMPARLRRSQRTSKRSRQPELVLAAPVLSERGLSYVPVGLPKVPVSLASRAVGENLQQLQPLEAQCESAAEAAGAPASASSIQQHQHKSQRSSGPSEAALDLTLPRQPQTPVQQPPHQQPPAQSPAASASTSRGQLTRLVRISQHSQQQQQQQQQQRKSGSVASLMSVCKDCKIGFFNYNNYVVHRSLYCQSSRLAAAAAKVALPATQPPTAPPPTSAPPPPQPTVKEPVTPAAAVTETAAVSGQISANSDRKFQCPYCQIRFHSPSTLTAHQAFYCPENPDKAVAGTTAADAAQDAAASSLQQQQQRVQSPTWLPILSECSPLGGGGGGGYKCSICGYIGQTERGMKMHAKIHCGGSLAAAATSPTSATSAADSGGGGGIRLPTAFPSEILSSMTPDELCMLQHKTQPYSKRRTFKRLGHHHHQGQLQHPGLRQASARQPLVCVRCGDAFDQLELLLEHQETACSSSPATVKLESIRQN